MLETYSIFGHAQFSLSPPVPIYSAANKSSGLRGRNPRTDSVKIRDESAYDVPDRAEQNTRLASFMNVLKGFRQMEGRGVAAVRKAGDSSVDLAIYKKTEE